VLDGSGPFTVFAPTDEAFAALPEGTLEALLKPESRQKLTDILKYHVVSSRVYSDQAVQAGRAATLLGRSVETSVTAGGLQVGDARVVAADLETANGVIHVIDSVLLPKPFSRRDAMVTLEEAVRSGVPAFNHGNHRECAEIYTKACQKIVDSHSDQVPHSVMTTLQKALERSGHMQHSTLRAWALRHGIDAAYADLRDLSGENSASIMSTSAGKSEARTLFSFHDAEAAEPWQTTNDGVMGGRSDGQFRINDDRNMEFFGTLSLANNGGFASVRATGGNLGLDRGDAITARVRGDGREYSLNLYTPSRRIAFCYRAKFETTQDEWIEIRIPLDEFVATSFGRVIPDYQLDPSEVNGLGILLGDKKAGPFELEIEWIKVVRANG
jgi:monofunctional biosynthetic peptidoglycan transglycosylase